MNPPSDDTLDSQLALLQDRLERDPTDVQARIEMGVLLAEALRRPAEALAHLSQAVRLAPESVAARFWMAGILAREYGDSAGARKHLEAALTTDPSRPEALDLMAAVLEDLGDLPERSLDCLERAVLSAPGWVTPYHGLALTYLRMGRLDEAEAAVRQALELIERTVQPESRSPLEAMKHLTATRPDPILRKRLIILLKDIQYRRLRRTVSDLYPEGE